MIIWLASYPRSGNTFYRVLLRQIYDQYTYDIYQLAKASPDKTIELGLGLNSISSPSFEEMVQSDQVQIVKTHDLPQEDYPAIYLIRDGRDALVSYAHFILHHVREIPLDQQADYYADTLRTLVETDDGFGGWSANVLAWTSRSTLTAYLKFEDLIQDPIDSVRRSLDTVGYQPPILQTSGQAPTFDKLHSQFPHFFRTGRVGSWRGEMPDDVHDLFWKRHGEAMHRMGYSK